VMYRQNATGQNATGQNATREVNGLTKCHWRGQLLAHALSQTHLLRLGSYVFFSWVFFTIAQFLKTTYTELKRLQ